MVPLRAVHHIYIDGGRAELSGLWVDDAALAGLAPATIKAQLGERWVRADGAPAWGGSGLGFIRFPVTADVLLASRSPAGLSGGGVLPDPPARVEWSGSAFSPGRLLSLEHLLTATPVPLGSEVGEIEPDGGLRVLARWDRRSWEPT